MLRHRGDLSNAGGSSQHNGAPTKGHSKGIICFDTKLLLENAPSMAASLLALLRFRTELILSRKLSES